MAPSIFTPSLWAVNRLTRIEDIVDAAVEYEDRDDEYTLWLCTQPQSGNSSWLCWGTVDALTAAQLCEPFDTALADELAKAKAGQCWSSPQEMESAKSGDYPHGTIDECQAGGKVWHRVWHDQNATWYTTPE